MSESIAENNIIPLKQNEFCVHTNVYCVTKDKKPGSFKEKLKVHMRVGGGCLFVSQMSILPK